MISIKKQSGILLEIPLLFFGYAAICVIFLRPELHKNPTTLLIPMIAGVGVLAILSSISEFTYRVMKISIGTWIFIVGIPLSWFVVIQLSLKSTDGDHAIASTFIFLTHVLICYLIDKSFITLRYRKWQSEQKEPEDNYNEK